MARKMINLSDENIKKIEEYSSKGLTVLQISSLLGISKSTFDRRISDSIEAKEALERGRAKIIYEVSSKCLELVMSGKHPNLMIFWLKSVAKWNDKVTEDTSKPREITLNYSMKVDEDDRGF